MAASMGSTDRTGSRRLRLSASTIELLPVPGSPETTISTPGPVIAYRRGTRLQTPRERVAGVQVALLEARGEPLVSLLRRAVRPALGVDLTLDLRLDPVVADRRRRVERLGDVGLRHVGDDLRRRGMVGPHPGEAIGLQLEPDRR